MNQLNEDKRSQLLGRSKNGQNYKDQSKGKNRYVRRLKSRLSSSTKEYNQLDMNKLFKDGILTVDVPMHGETDDYLVRMSFGGFLEILRDQIERDERLDLRSIIRALQIGFNKTDTFIHCTCPDWKYRMAYWATRNSINSGEPETIPSDETNPNDKLGPGCKHVLLALSNSSWIIKVASVINNYINYMKKHYQKAYADIIFPAIYGKKYDDAVQLGMFDVDAYLPDDQETINKANEIGAKSGQFQKGNVKGVRFAPSNKPDENQTDLDIEDSEENNEETT